ncbi:MAG: divalent-cation tolerance protein CutA [Balneolaceae bacterium]
MFKNLRFVYITTSGREEARRIGQILVEDKFAACVNILDGMESIYRWDDKVITDQECVLIAKTEQRHLARLTRRVKELHSYDCPCIVTLTVTEQEGNKEYLQWLIDQTANPEPELNSEPRSS